MGVQEIRWNKGGTEPPDDYTLCMNVGKLMITYRNASTYRKESYHGLRGQSLIVIRYHT